MFDKLKPTLSTLLHTMLGINLKTNSSSLVPEILPPISEPIATYCQRLSAMKEGGKTELEKWRVTHARAYKSKATSRHEYVAVAVLDPHNKTSYVAIERGRGDPEPIPSSDTNIQQNGLFSSSNPSLSSITSLSSDSSPTRFADDKIAPLPATGKWNKSDEEIGKLEFKKPIYLHELAILALIVHDQNPSYLLMSNNCYHFAGTIMKVLEEHYDTVSDAGAGAGRWCGIVVYSGKENITLLLEKFREIIKKFESLPDLSLENAQLRERLRMIEGESK